MRGWRANLATSVFDDQAALLAAIDDGTCAVGIVGSDALARYSARDGETNLGSVFPDAESGGTRFDLTAAGVSRHANDAENYGEESENRCLRLIRLSSVPVCIVCAERVLRRQG